jgi:hypothetical protein
LRWFDDDTYVRDSRPWDVDPVGWYQFDLPVGTTAFDCPVRGDARVWVDGAEKSVAEGRVTLDAPVTEPTPGAVRVAQERGRYVGATWAGPVGIETDPTDVELRSWEALGYRHYSGRGRYRTSVELPDIDPDDRVTLDLGELHVSAAVRVNDIAVGSVCSRPFSIDVSEVVEPGTNTFEIEVANTLVNHLQSETPRDWVEASYMASVENPLPNVARDEPVSGMLGPVRLQIEPDVTVEAE